MLEQIRHSRLSRRVDDHVGARIRLRRTLMGMTQEQLAEALGISYQQVQKYETGANRVSAGRLSRIAQGTARGAQQLGADISYFFDGLDSQAAARALPHGGRNRVAIDLVRNFLEIANEDQRTALANLVKSMKPGPTDSVATS